MRLHSVAGPGRGPAPVGGAGLRGRGAGDELPGLRPRGRGRPRPGAERHLDPDHHRRADRPDRARGDEGDHRRLRRLRARVRHGPGQHPTLLANLYESTAPPWSWPPTPTPRPRPTAAGTAPCPTPAPYRAVGMDGRWAARRGRGAAAGHPPPLGLDRGLSRASPPAVGCSPGPVGTTDAYLREPVA